MASKREDIKKRQKVSYPPKSLVEKLDNYSKEKGKDGKPQSDSQSIIDALNFFFRYKDKVHLIKLEM
jgi:hypothetical protein